jgi:hypothetical protein
VMQLKNACIPHSDNLFGGNSEDLLKDRVGIFAQARRRFGVLNRCFRVLDGIGDGLDGPQRRMLHRRQHLH